MILDSNPLKLGMNKNAAAAAPAIKKSENRPRPLTLPLVKTRANSFHINNPRTTAPVMYPVVEVVRPSISAPVANNGHAHLPPPPRLSAARNSNNVDQTAKNAPAADGSLKVAASLHTPDSSSLTSCFQPGLLLKKSAG